MTPIHIVCPACGGVNRVPSSRLGDQPGCGKCRRPLLGGPPVELDGSSFDRFLTRNDLPVVVDFWAPWCAPCRVMAPVFEQVAGRLGTRARFAKVDTETAPDIAARYAIRSIPTLAVFRDGRELDRVAGALDRPRLEGWINGLL